MDSLVAERHLMPAKRKNCPDCKRALSAIKIIDKRGTHKHGVLEYAVGQAKRSKWSGHFPVEGKILAYVCDACGRVLFYAQPKE